MGEFIFNFLSVFALAMMILTWIVFSLYPDKSKKDGNETFILMILLTAIISTVISVYITAGPEMDINTAAKYGQMGDFFGGMLNPILAFASFIALLYTIRIQSEELRLTKDELAKSAEAHVKSEATLRDQLKDSQKQHEMNHYHSLLQNIDAKLHSEIYVRNWTRNPGSFKCISDFLRECFEAVKKDQHIGVWKNLYDAKSKRPIAIAEHRVVVLLAQLSVLLTEYQLKFGATAVYTSYTLQYTEVISIMHAIGIINARVNSYQIFNIDEYFEANNVVVD
ncbi:MAG TPA: hypothetical protein DF774_02255 [Rheinheimera sp.]|uniref:hypothetical protein n=1 Tax=Rheinheimera sp. TaxID=1869214 RepID=UPI000EC9D8AE|nr:hypothetical protein [Rheinheimera sp.]HCU64563.1 hypothetical protein [Rheinheimera sp.]